MPDPSLRTFEDVLKTHIVKFDAAVAEIRSIHLDMEHVNEESREYHKAMERFVEANKALWTLKSAWSYELE